MAKNFQRTFFATMVGLIAACFTCASAVSAQTIEISQSLFTTDGDPALVANTTPYGGGEISWSICPPGGEPCAPFKSDEFLEPGPQPAGTVFEASSVINGTTKTARSAPWLGRVTSIEPPSLLGRNTVGARVTPTPGQWSGGWANDLDDLHVEACRTPQGTRCETISAPLEDYPGAKAPIVIGLRYAGWFVFAVDARFGRDSISAGVGHLSPLGITPLVRGQTVAQSISTAPVPVPSDTWIKVAKRAHKRKSGFKLATVRCPARCRVRVVGMADQPSIRRFITGTFVVDKTDVDRAGSISIKPRLYHRNQPATLSYEIWIDGGLAAVGRTRLFQ